MKVSALGPGAIVALLLAISTPADADESLESCVTAAESAARLTRAQTYGAARPLLLKCTRPECPAIVRKDCTELLARVDVDEPTVAFRVTVDGSDCIARVEIDGTVSTDAGAGKAISLDPGPHAVTASCPGAQQARAQIVVRAGEKLRLVPLPLTAEGERPRPATSPPKTAATTTPGGPPNWPFIVGSVGAASVVVGGVFGALALGKSSALKSRCAAACAPDDVSTMKTQGVLADVFIDVGLVLVVGSVIWWATARTPAPAVTAVAYPLTF